MLIGKVEQAQWGISVAINDNPLLRWRVAMRMQSTIENISYPLLPLTNLYPWRIHVLPYLPLVLSLFSNLGHHKAIASPPATMDLLDSLLPSTAIHVNSITYLTISDITLAPCVVIRCLYLQYCIRDVLCFLQCCLKIILYGFLHLHCLLSLFRLLLQLVVMLLCSLSIFVVALLWWAYSSYYVFQ